MQGVVAAEATQCLRVQIVTPHHVGRVRTPHLFNGVANVVAFFTGDEIAVRVGAVVRELVEAHVDAAARSRARHHRNVAGAVAAHEVVAPRAAGEGVVAGAAVEGVVPDTTEERVVPIGAGHAVVAVTAVEHIVVAAAVHEIVAAATGQDVRRVTADDPVRRVRSGERVAVAGAPLDELGANVVAFLGDAIAVRVGAVVGAARRGHDDRRYARRVGHEISSASSIEEVGIAGPTRTGIKGVVGVAASHRVIPGTANGVATIEPLCVIVSLPVPVSTCTPCTPEHTAAIGSFGTGATHPTPRVSVVNAESRTNTVVASIGVTVTLFARVA